MKEPSVTLINFTQNARELLIITKSTRLTMDAGTREKVFSMPEEEKDKEIAYIATSIPSSWEFVTYTFAINNVTRAFAEQFKRTRTGSYAQQTMRMLPMEKFEYGIGPSIMNNVSLCDRYTRMMTEIQSCYDQLIEGGAAIEDARGILPLNIHTNLVAQFNLRTLADLAKSRSGKRTQAEYRDGVLPQMISAILEVHPWAKDFLFKDVHRVCNELEHLISADVLMSSSSKTATYKLIDQIRRLQ